MPGDAIVVVLVLLSLVYLGRRLYIFLRGTARGGECAKSGLCSCCSNGHALKDIADRPSHNTKSSQDS